MSFTPISAGNMVVTTSDHGAYIVIAAVLGVTWSVLVLAIRLYIRLHLNGPFGPDDAAASFGTVAGICQTSLTLTAVHYGLGKRQELLSPDQLDTAMKYNYTANLVYIIAICSAKCSMSLLMARLTRYTHSRIASHAISCLAIAWAITALFVLGFQCPGPRPWNTQDLSRCPSFFTRWVAIEAFSVLIEVLISSMAVVLVWNLSMATKTKVMVVCAFSAQLLIVIPIAFRLDFLRARVSGSDATFDTTNAAISTQVVVHLSIMAATFPCFRQFLQAFDSGLGATTKIPTELGTGSQSHSGYVLQSLSGTCDEGRSVNKQHAPTKLRPDPTAEITSEATADGQDPSPSETRRSTDSFGSDKAIIWKTQKWEIRYESRE
ncbi:MFS transporter [Hirsutella rhossiliensis]|uniref:MFS transporter n=1 Tax=Hirsutella rhossiliensis TaxID=111463 RepID=A0A9P8N5K3_9HYPO|nr:MFS transporter [Hirsutella rhossiliensis]KAH0966164.1 MFS transporter [Hirsutella rhossiliensis]